MTADIQAVPFYLDSLVSRSPGGSAPVTDFAAGADIELAWDSNGTAFTLYAAKDARPLYTGAATSFVVKGGRTKSTTFVLVASVTGGPSTGSPFPGFQEITLTDALTVTISDPALTPSAVTAGTLTVSGATNLAAATAASVQVSGTLQASGLATLSGGVKTGPLSVSGGASLQGGATLDTATVTGAFAAANANLANVTASTLAVTNAVSMFNPQPIAAGGHTSTTDGIVIGACNWPDNGSAKCTGVVWGWTAVSGYVCGTGGNTVAWADGSGSAMCGVGGSFALPVKAGVEFKLGANLAGDIQAPTQFTWIPFGTNAKLTAASDEQLAAAGFAEPDFAPPSPPEPFDPDWAIAEIVSVFNEYAGVGITDEEEQRLTSALQVLATHDQSLTYVPTD